MSTTNENGFSEKKKVTNKDVAKFAGVSVATVSYVMNGRTDKRIPESTRKKVLQAANFLNYVPNTFAAGLRSVSSAPSIAVRLPEKAFPLAELSAMLFLRDFSAVCAEEKFTLAYLAEKRPARLAANACVCIGLSKEEFHALCDENFIPVIALDSVIDDPVFYQINLDAVKMRGAVENAVGAFTYIALDSENEELKSRILQAMPDTVFVSTFAQFFAACQKGQCAVSDPALIELATDMRAENVFLYRDYPAEKCKLVMEAVKKALSRESVPDEEHFILA